MTKVKVAAFHLVILVNNISNILASYRFSHFMGGIDPSPSGTIVFLAPHIRFLCVLHLGNIGGGDILASCSGSPNSFFFHVFHPIFENAFTLFCSVRLCMDLGILNPQSATLPYGKTNTFLKSPFLKQIEQSMIYAPVWDRFGMVFHISP